MMNINLIIIYILIMIKMKKKQNYFNKNDNITKINIILDNDIKSFEKLFHDCECIKKIKFIKFKRNDINNMSYMFYECSSLKELNLHHFNTINVKDMSGMFYACSDELIKKIRNQYNNIIDEAFEDLIYIQLLNKFYYNYINLYN